jgi:hypothetical protein
MKENADEFLENLVKKTMKSSPLEAPPSDFTSNIMARINVKSTTTVYQPLISKMGWMLILTTGIAYVVYLYVISAGEPNDWFKAVDFSTVSNNEIVNFFSELKLARITTYAMVVCGLMLCAQVPILKYFITKRQQGSY